MLRIGRTLRRVSPLVIVAACTSCAAGATNPSPTPPIVIDASTATPTATAALDPADAPDECGGADVDLAAVLANRRCRARPDAPPTPASAATDVKVTLTPSTAKVAPGGHVDLALELANTGSASVPLYFGGDLTLAVAVTDAKGANIAPPAGNAPKNADPKCAQVNCRLPASHVVLAPGGKAHARIGWDAVKVAWPATGPTTCCTVHVDPVAKGPLAIGAYRVKVPLPYESNQGSPADPEVEIRVAK